MSLDSKCMVTLGACLVGMTLLVSGCNQPAPRLDGGAVDLSFQQTAKGTEKTIQTSSNQGDMNKGPNTTEQPTAQAERTEVNQTKTNSLTNNLETNKIDGITNSTIQESSTKQENKSAETGAEVHKSDSSQPKPPAEQQISASGETINSQPVKSAAAASTATAASVEPLPKPVPSQTASQTASSSAIPLPQSSQESSAEAKPAANIVKDLAKAATITFKDLYSDMTVRGVKFSDKLTQLANKKVEMTGFMAPPLTAKVNFFVLTRVAMSICPFCSTDADWPIDIVVVSMPKGKEVIPTEHQVKVTGTLSIGSQTDEATGFVSLIRIIADKVEVLN
ncbi:hypothetical protein SAMN03159341_110102 [Paenibacillus sp. 1_12]|uniref:hypothetical protein n=1 Tax=Paenibacillus sp. 1_12 TaxID=1566278 RepID=UPI0008EF9E16|nr:hypothetical protein [Paenibacillus sp. 1_12]SFL82130.1 hypothetical protein SAMN03159341_110102 [Paenibacillus sp. 1_12]